MDKIQKLIIAVLGLALAGIMIVGIVFSITHKDDKPDIDYDEKDFSTTTTVTTTKPQDSSSADTEDSTTTTTPTTTTPTNSDEENESSSSTTEKEESDTSSSTTEKEEKPNGELEISASDLTVYVGATKTISVEFSDNSNKPALTFKSGNTKIATVDKNGKVTGVALGSCKVTITTSTGDKVTIDVKVTDKYGTEATASKTMYANGCNFRKGPGVGYEAIRVLDVNEKVTIIGKNGAWYKISAKGTEGFVKGEFLSDKKFTTNSGDSGNSGNSSSSGNNGNSGGNTTKPEKPTDTPDEPTDTPDEPTDTPDEPTDTPDEPTDTPDEPIDTPDEPTEGEDTGSSDENAEINE